MSNLTIKEKYELEDYLYCKNSKVYRKRIEQAKEIIKRFLDISKRPYLACSWGKDSVVMLHLTQTIKPDILTIFNHCLELPDTLKTRDIYLKQFPATNYKEIKSEVEYSWIKNIHDEKHLFDVVFKASDKLCDFIYDDINVDGCLLGLRKQESIKRRMLLSKKTSVYWNHFRKMWIGNPLANFQHEDIFAYAYENQIQLSDRYYKEAKFNNNIRGEIRTSWTIGSAMLTAGRISDLKYNNLGLYNQIRSEIKDIENYT